MRIPSEHGALGATCLCSRPCLQPSKPGNDRTLLNAFPCSLQHRAPAGINSPWCLVPVSHGPLFCKCYINSFTPSNPVSQRGPELSPLFSEGETEAQKGKCFAWALMAGRGRASSQTQHLASRSSALPPALFQPSQPSKVLCVTLERAVRPAGCQPENSI